MTTVTTGAGYEVAGTSPEPGRRTAPGVVLAACWALLGVAAMRSVSAIASFYAIPEGMWQFAEAEGDDTAGAAGALGLILSGSFAVFMVTVYIVLAALIVRGFPVARILTWIVAGLTICGTMPSLFVDVYDAIDWYNRVTVASGVSTLVLLVVAIVLLALPSANSYFRERRRKAPPPAPPYAWPGYGPPGYRPPGPPPPQWPGPSGPPPP
jgi:U5 snRNP spliceosome subunit